MNFNNFLCVFDECITLHFLSLRLAGEGIKYVWALAKIYYRKAPIAKKRCKVKFRDLVRESSDTQTVLDLKHVQAHSRCAMSYMKLYKVIQTISMTEELSVNKHSLL